MQPCIKIDFRRGDQVKEHSYAWNIEEVGTVTGWFARRVATKGKSIPYTCYHRDPRDNGGGNVTISSRGFRQASPFNGTEWVFNGKYYVKSLVNGGQWQDSIIQILNTSIRYHRVLKPHCVVRQKACDKRGVISVDYMMRYDERDGKFIQGNWANFVETDERMKGGAMPSNGRSFDHRCLVAVTTCFLPSFFFFYHRIIHFSHSRKKIDPLFRIAFESCSLARDE